MAIRRKGLWLAYGIIFVFYWVAILLGDSYIQPSGNTLAEWWNKTATLAFIYNLFLPVAAGIISADRLVRDRALHMEEILQSTSLKTVEYLTGKYMGSLVAVTLPALAGILTLRFFALLQGAPIQSIWMTVAAFFTVNFPAYGFVIAFSLSCPLVIPLRVYQVLFTGYWFWGNYLPTNIFPSLSSTLMQPSGRVAAEGLFGAVMDPQLPLTYSTGDVWINYGLLTLSAILILIAAGWKLDQQKALA
jgi:ABC-2 type transport system permease protein